VDAGNGAARRILRSSLALALLALHAGHHERLLGGGSALVTTWLNPRWFANRMHSSCVFFAACAGAINASTIANTNTASMQVEILTVANVM
jgi:hypothetical protein